MPKAFIIIVNYNGWQDTKECLKSLEELNYDNFEIIVVDNASTDNSVKHLNSHIRSIGNHSQIRIITNAENLGFAGGNNVGIKYALKQKVAPVKSSKDDNGASYILLLNNDTIVNRNFLKELIKVGEGDKKIGILGPKIFFYNSKRVWFNGGKINWLYTRGIHISNKVRRVSDRSNKSRHGRDDQTSGVNEVDYITGCCLFIKREVIEKIGLMDEDYFLYYEDVDWCLKTRKAGYKCVLVPKSIIWHKASSSAKEGSSSYIYYHTRNGLLLAKKNAPFFIKIFAHLQSIWILGKQIIKLIFFPKRRMWARTIMVGIIDFYRNNFGKLAR